MSNVLENLFVLIFLILMMVLAIKLIIFLLGFVWWVLLIGVFISFILVEIGWKG